jgi:hypothetical protein
MLSDQNYKIKQSSECIKELSDQMIRCLDKFGDIDNFTVEMQLNKIKSYIRKIENTLEW